MKIADIKRVAEAARSSGLAILERWLPGGKVRSNEYIVVNPHRSDNTAGSLSINVDTGMGSDFATGEGFKDYVAVVAFADQVGMLAAATALAEFLNIPLTSGNRGVLPTGAKKVDSSNEPPTKLTAEPAPTSAKKVGVQICTPSRCVMPVPDDAPTAPIAHVKLGKADMLFPYVDAEGRTLGFIYRWNATAKKSKEFRPLTLWADAAGRLEWKWQTWPVPRPLYGLEQLKQYPERMVFLHEGEKSADAGRVLLPEDVHLAWPGGANAADKADYTPLAGREVNIWPDHDVPGIAAASKAAKALRKAGALTVHYLDVPATFAKFEVQKGRIVSRLSPLLAGWDCADAVAEGWTAALAIELFDRPEVIGKTFADKLVATAEAPTAEETAQPENVYESTDSEHAEPEPVSPSGPFELDDAGLWFVSFDKEQKKSVTRICAPIYVTALGRNVEGANWSICFEFRDRDGHQRREVIPYKQFLGLTHDGVKTLVDLGLEIEGKTKALELLRFYVLSAKPDNRVKLVPTIGWHNRAFVLPDGTIGSDGDEVLMFAGSSRALGVYESRGTLEDWRSYIARPAVGNPRLMFLLAVSFAGPLLEPLGIASAAFHFTGDSSTGKTAGLQAAGSTWGPPEMQVLGWRLSPNAGEYLAGLHNNLSLILDEIKQGDGKDVAAQIYMYMNGRGKERAHYAGGLREATMFRLIVLSSGEIGLADHLAAAGQKHYAGQEVRMIEVNADAGAGYGMWNDVAGYANQGKTFSDNLKRFSGRYYGRAGRAFISELIKRLDSLPGWWRDYQGDFSRNYKPEKAAGQVQRVMTSFCLAGFAGELAAKWEIVPWEKGAATKAAADLFREWWSARPSVGNSEDAQILAHVRSVLERTWQSKYVDWERVDEPNADLSRMAAVHDSLGFRKKEIGQAGEGYLFYVTRSRFREEFAQKGGFKHKRVAGLLKERGALRCDADGTTWRETLPNGDPRSYCLVGERVWNLGDE